MLDTVDKANKLGMFRAMSRKTFLVLFIHLGKVAQVAAEDFFGFNVTFHSSQCGTCVGAIAQHFMKSSFNEFDAACPQGKLCTSLEFNYHFHFQ